MWFFDIMALAMVPGEASGDVGGGTGDGSDGAGGTGASQDRDTGAPPETFFSGIKDDGLKAWAQGKGWKTADDALSSYRNLERHMGVPEDRLVRVPKDGDADGFKEAMRRLGAPDSPEGYQFELPEAVDDGFVEWAREAFSKAALTPGQAKAVVQAYTEYAGQFAERGEADARAKAEVDTQELRREWGSGFDNKLRMAQRAARGLGVEEEAITALEQVQGFPAVMKMFAQIGEKFSEDNFVSGSGGPVSGDFGGMAPADARVEWEKMASDPDEVRALLEAEHPRHQSALQKKAALFAAMYPTSQ